MVTFLIFRNVSSSSPYDLEHNSVARLGIFGLFCTSRENFSSPTKTDLTLLDQLVDSNIRSFVENRIFSLPQTPIEVDCN